ncbi:unnamed protein product [Phaedon cochleariae]|uniref:Ig-like domain-containing protein n=1 Tax=Phaedon cochleariae TaxID=80249 RepID=A0A9N9SFQ4_PHACE|nr:unnamed protein product [Phaedon cochleariae]
MLTVEKVSWVRHRDIHLLTVGRYTYTSDQRFEAVHTPHTEEWTLRLRYPQKKDSGIYECQISTTPPIGHFVFLSIVALSLAERTETEVVVVGEDIDLLVILTGLCLRDNVFFLKPGKGNVPPTTYSPMHALTNKTIREYIMFLHAMSGCDTTSAPYNQGKFVKTVTKNPNLADVVSVFKNPEATPESIATAGERFLVNLYGFTGRTEPSINCLRYINYAKAAFKTSSKIAALPPSAAAATQHSFRVYLQVQQWLGVEKNAEDWGWKRATNGLEPINSLQAPAPLELLRLVSCRCIKTWAKKCSCKKAGLDCTNLCIDCEGSCNNVTIEADLTIPPNDGPFDVEVQDELGFTFAPVVETIEKSMDKEDEEPITEILGSPELFINLGSTINLTCVVRYAPEPHSNIVWSQNSELINFDSPRGGISLVTEKGLVTTSRLLIQKAGEHPAAMHHGHGSLTGLSHVTLLLSLVVLLIVLPHT